MHLPATATRSEGGIDTAWLAPLVLFAGCLLLYSIHLGRMAHPDEYYHILAAKGLLETGEPSRTYVSPKVLPVPFGHGT